MRLRIEAIAGEPLAEVRYLNAARGGGTVVERLPIVAAELAVDGSLSDELDAIVACSDLQGIVRGHEGLSELLGIAVVDALEELAFDGKLPPLARCGAILAGDLYSVPEANKRGGHGDVTEVWAAFASRFAWVAGVAGNHDEVSGVTALGANVHLLDGDLVELDGLSIAGVGGIIGNKRKPGRREEAEYLALLDRALDREPALVVLHEGPHGDNGQQGNAAIRATLEAGRPALTIRGHDHWANPIAEHAAGQVLNVDARCVVLRIKR